MRSAEEGVAALVARAEGAEGVQAVGVREQAPAVPHLAVRGEPGQAEPAAHVRVVDAPVRARAEQEPQACQVPVPALEVPE